MRNSFFWSHTLLKVLGGSYGRLYNWFCTQPQYTKVKYGYLYNGWVGSDSRKVSAINARIPSNTEWTALFTYLGRTSVAGGKLKETGFIYWDNPNLGATNKVSFNARGSGMRDGSLTPDCFGLLTIARYWSSTIFSSSYTYYQLIGNGSTSINSNATSNKIGSSIRLIVDTPIEISGNSAIYVGNDLRRYKCVLINGIWYLAENLAETKYRDGSLIPKVTDNTAWAALTTGAMCAYNNDEANAFETASIAPVGFHVIDDYDLYNLSASLGGDTISGGKLKEIGFVSWDSPNTGATNEVNFNAKGAGWRNNSTGSYAGLKVSSYLLSSKSYDVTQCIVGVLSYTSSAFNSGTLLNKKSGGSIRIAKNGSVWTAGDTLTDYDGNIYPLIKIGNTVITAKNWKCTKYNDGTPIPNVTDNAAWAALTTGGQCIYENNLANL